jgi:hypothetical protein
MFVWPTAASDGKQSHDKIRNWKKLFTLFFLSIYYLLLFDACESDK